MKFHYTYRLTAINPIDSRVEYIGVRSSGIEPVADVAYMSSSRTIAKLIAEGVLFTKQIISVWPTRAAAVAHEVELHNLHDVGRSPRFFNKAKQTAVGFDTGGVEMPAISAAAKERMADPEFRAAHSARAKAMMANPDMRARVAATLKATLAKPEVKAVMSENQKRVMADGGAEKTADGLRKYYADEKNREKQASRMREAMSRPEVKEKMNAIYASKEHKNSGREAAIRGWSNPEKSAARVAKIREKCAAPDWAGRRVGADNPMSLENVKAAHKAAVSSPEAIARKREVFAIKRRFIELSGYIGNKRTVTLAKAEQWLAQNA